MTDDKDVTFSLKVMINRKKTKVLFAEADSDFTDVLLSFLTLPLGPIVRVLQKHYGDEAPVIGSLSTLYKGLADLDSVHFWTEAAKKILLNPRSSSEAECRKLKLNVDDCEPTKYFRCGNSSCNYSRHSNIAMYYECRCGCGGTINTEVPLRVSEDGDVRGFTKNTASFIISDDLRILPNSTGFLDTLSNIGITDMDGAELRNVSFGFHEIMDLLKRSLLSSTPLSDIILSKRRSAAAKSEFGTLFPPLAKEEISNSKMMNLKVMVQKSTNKFLFAQVEEDFVDFLFSFLTIPLGAVVCLLNSNTSLANIDNLHKSVAHFITDKYLRKDMKNKLINPMLPHLYLSENQILPVVEESAPKLYYHYNTPSYLSTDGTAYPVTSFKSPRGHANYVKGPTTYMVTDDLVVTQYCMGSGFSIINRLNIPMSDLKELELHIGLQEALRILKASLSSGSALTDALINIHDR